jgi:hypothetical protein
MNMKLFFSPDDATGTGTESLSEEAQDLAQLDDIEEVDETGGEEEAPETDEEVLEVEGEEDDAEEEGQEEETEEAEGEERGEQALPERDESGRLSVKGIKTLKDGKYAELFKDIPELKAAYFQLPKYQEVFADPELAKEAKGKADEYDTIEQTLIGQTDPEFLLNTLNNNAPKALVKLMKAFPATLQKIENTEAYRALANPIIEDLLYHASQYGNRTQDKNLYLAARHLANFIWANGGEIPDIAKREVAKAPSEAEQTLERERAQYRQEKFQTAVVDIGADCATSVTSILSNKLGGLTPFEKKMLIKEARTELDDALKKDTTLQGTLKTLWTKARQDGYSPASKERIKNAWLSRAKAVAPGIRNRLKDEAIGSRTNGGDSRQEPQKKRSFISKGGLGARSNASRVLDPHKIDWRKTSDEDILGDGSKVHLKK